MANNDEGYKAALLDLATRLNNMGLYMLSVKQGVWQLRGETLVNISKEVSRWTQE